MALSNEFFVSITRDGTRVIYAMADSPAQALRKLQNARTAFTDLPIQLLRKNERGEFVDVTEGTVDR